MLKYGESDILPTRSVLTSISRGFCDFPRGRALLTLRNLCPIKNQIPRTITRVHICMHNGHSSMFDLYTMLICRIFVRDP